VNRVFKYLFAAFFALAFVALCLALLNAWRGLRDMRTRLAELEERLRDSDNACLELHQKIYELENNPWAVERTAREKARLCRKGDLIFVYDEVYPSPTSSLKDADSQSKKTEGASGAD
jgi:hypothetical protein